MIVADANLPQPPSPCQRKNLVFPDGSGLPAGKHQPPRLTACVERTFAVALAHSAEEYRPGFAKRAENFEEICNVAVGWQWEPGINCARIKDAIAVGTPDLTMGERCVLAAYATYLNEKSLERSLAYVWPSAGLIARQLGCSPSLVRGYRKSLEAKGYLVRDYNRANRPAGNEAFDLSPTAARLEEMEAHESQAREDVRLERETWQSHVVSLGRYRAQAPESQHLEQSQSKNSNPVRGSDAPKARSDLQERRDKPADNPKAPRSSTRRPAPGKSSAICSPGGASGFSGAQPGNSVAPGMARAELLLALQLCPQVADMVPPHVREDPADATPSDVARWAAQAAALLPEARRNNDQTFIWAFERHGVRALTMLAIVLTDPAIENRCNYFGWMAKQDPAGAPDLRFNLARLSRSLDARSLPSGPPEVRLSDQSSEPARHGLDAPEGSEDPVWMELSTAIRRRIRDGAYGSWFERLAFHGISEGLLTLSSTSETVASKIKSEFVPAIIAAAEDVGLVVERVVVIVRKREAR